MKSLRTPRAHTRPQTANKLLKTFLVMLLISLMVSGVGYAQSTSTQSASTIVEQGIPEAPAPDEITPEDNSFTRTYYTQQDTYVNAGSMGTNYGDSVNLEVARTLQTPLTLNKYTLIGFNVTDLPANAVIDNAVLQIYSEVNMGGSPDSPEAITIVPDALNSAWEEMDVDWLSRPTMTNLGDLGLVYSSGWHNINVFNIVNAWQTSAAVNYGIGLRLSGSQLGTAIFHSRETGVTTTPRLVVTYHTEGSPAKLPVQEDTYIDSSAPASNFGTLGYFRVGAGSASRYGLLKFDLSDLPANIQVTSAHLWLYSEINKVPDSPEAPNDIYPYIVTSSWSENTVTWNTNVQALYRNDVPAVYEIGWLDVPVTNIVSDWISGTYINNGIQLRLGAAGTTSYDFYAIPAANLAYLLIEYEDAPPPCTPITSVSLSGPTSGLTDTSYTFTAGITPIDATAPITYTFSATDFSPVSSSSNTISYSWSTPGLKIVQAEAENCGGIQTTSLQINISEPPPECDYPLAGLDINGPTEGLVNTSYTYSSVIIPDFATQPVTYGWQASGHAGTLPDPEVTYAWSLSGTQSITLTAENCGGSFVAYHPFEVFEPEDLPDLVVSSAWYEPDSNRIGFLVQNTGGRPAPIGFRVEAYMNDSLLGAGSMGYIIPAGAVRAGYINASWSCSGVSADLEVRADTLNTVLEGNETNNSIYDNWTCDLTPPNILQGPTVTEITEHTAVISWRTDDSTTTHLEYGWSTYSPLAIDETVPAAAHSIELTGLVSGMSYFFDIEATNTNDQLLVVSRQYFTTLPPGSDPPNITSITLEEYPLDMYQFYTLSAGLSDPSHTQRVEFYWDDERIGTDYSWEDGFKMYISPHQMGWTRSDFFYFTHSIRAIAYNLEGEQGIRTENIKPALTEQPLVVNITAPGDGYAVYYDGASVPAGTVITSTVEAYTTEWKCTKSGFSELNPGGLPGILCKDMMETIPTVNISLMQNSDEISTVTVYPDDVVFDAPLDLGGLTNGSYEVKASVSYYGGAEDSQDLIIIFGDVPLEVTRSVTRSQNFFTVELRIKNMSSGTVNLDRIEDSMIGFHQVGYGAENPAFTIEPNGYFSGEAFVNRPEFNVDAQILPNQTYLLSYQIVPVMYEDYRLPKLGQLPVRITMSDGNVADVLAVAFEVNDPDFTAPILLEDAYLNALHTSDYVLVTNPWQANNHYGVDHNDDLHAVYGAMARLARLKLGVLAFTKTYDREVLNVRLEPGSWWTTMLDPAFQEINQGYVLLVGETEVIPAFYEGTDNFVTFVGIPDWVPYSDLRYAHTSGDTARPELVVGRIPGNTPGDWLNTLQHVIDVYIGELHWDGQIGLAASGRGTGVTSIMIPTIKIVDHVMDDANIYSTQLHLYDYDHDQRIMAMQANIIGKDTLIILGHGNPTSWNDSTFSPWNILNYAWNDIVPAVFAMSCKTGNYEDGSGDESVAEAFVNDAAGVYIGSTQNTEMWSGEWGVKKFTRQWANYPGRSFGQALNRMKNFAFAYDTGAFDHGKQLAFSYNLYGDPKFAVSPDLAVLMPEPEIFLTDRTLTHQAFGTQELHVQLPDFTIDPREDGDFIDIPGGDWLFRDGDYIVPMIVVQQDFPAGVWVQNVTLTSQDSLTTTHGLHLPRLMSLPFCEGCFGDPLPPAPEGWVPDLAEIYTWDLQVNPDGTSSLFLSIYPFHYNGETLDALYYQDLFFEVETIETSVSIDDLEVVELSHALNSQITINAWLNNSGVAQDLYANIEIRRQVSQELVDSLPLQRLSDVSGLASLSAIWDSANFPAGGYYVDLSLMDASGNILATQSADFNLGITSVVMTQFSVSPEIFEPGVAENIHLEVLNNGDVPLNGVAVIQVFTGEEISPTLIITHTISAFEPAQMLAFDDIWDPTGQTSTEFTLKAYIKYDSQSTPAWIIRLDDKYQLYLPLARR